MPGPGPSAEPSTDTIVPPLRLLVVDDEPEECKRLRDSLEPMGAKIGEAGSYDEASKKLAERQIDAVLVDLRFDYDPDDRRLVQPDTVDVPPTPSGPGRLRLHATNQQGALICHLLREDMWHGRLAPRPLIVLTNHLELAVDGLGLTCWAKAAVHKSPQTVIRRLRKLAAATDALAGVLADLEIGPVVRDQIIAEVVERQLEPAEVRGRLVQLDLPVDISRLWTAALESDAIPPPPEPAGRESRHLLSSTSSDLAPQPAEPVYIKLAANPPNEVATHWEDEDELGVLATLEPSHAEVWAPGDELLRGQTALAHVLADPKNAVLHTDAHPNLRWVSEEVTVVVHADRTPTRQEGEGHFALHDIGGPRLFQALFRPKRETHPSQLIPLLEAHCLLLPGKHARTLAETRGWLDHFTRRLNDSEQLSVDSDRLRSELQHHAERWTQKPTIFHKLSETGRGPDRWRETAYRHLLALSADRPAVRGVLEQWFGTSGQWERLPPDNQQLCRTAAARVLHRLLDDPWVDHQEITDLLPTIHSPNSPP